MNYKYIVSHIKAFMLKKVKAVLISAYGGTRPPWIDNGYLEIENSVCLGKDNPINDYPPYVGS